MFPAPISSGLPHQSLACQPFQSASTSFWQSEHVHKHLSKLRETVGLLKAVQEELEGILLLKRSSQNNAGRDTLPFEHLSERKFSPSSDDSTVTESSQYFENNMLLQFSEVLKAKKISLNAQESLSVEAANSLSTTLKSQLGLFGAITNQASPWEERSAAVKLAQKLKKSKRNKCWKKKKRRRVAEQLRKEHEDYDKADQEADEWRAREIAKDIARRKVESMKEIAKLKANEERKRLESELELVMVVEKLQELRSIRIQKMKKQGHFLPEEDDKYLERVRAAVEEEERQAAVAAETDAAKDAIAIAEESRKAIQSTSPRTKDINHNMVEAEANTDLVNGMENESCGMNENTKAELQKVEGHGRGGGYDSVANLPFEFYHYYHGSSNDMGTLIEVRRMWDAYIRPGGSRIPGHWVQPPPPADEVWASYLIRPT